jgi:pantothenate kinase
MRGAAISPPRRTIIGLIGGPGSGKSTITAKLINTLGTNGIPTAAIPMDGFHMRHAKLEALGLTAQKGIPHTFEAQAFADFLAQAKAATYPISGPIYTRDIEDVTGNGYTVAPETRVLIVEGNYLLLDTPPWHRVRPLLDLSVYLDIPRETARTRLLARHAEHGLFSPDHIARHVENVDLPNYDLVSATARHADLVISIQ